MNVFTVGELIDAGERVTSFTLESIEEDGTSKLLYEGTSVGYYRTVLFEEGEYRHFRFTVRSAMAEPLIKDFGLHLFEGSVASTGTQYAENLVEALERDVAKRRVVAAFGGIYPFNHVEFGTEKGMAYRVSAFNGLGYELIAEGVAESDVVTLFFDKTVEGSYQIKIESDVIDTDHRIVVRQK